MDSATRRAWLVALCVGAVLLAGPLLPASGFGSTPSTDRPVVGVPTPDPLDESPATPPGTAETPAQGARETPVATVTPAPNGREPGDQRPTATRTPTPTPAAPGPGGDAGGLGAVAFLAASLAAVAVAGVCFEGKSRGWPVFERLPIPAVSVTGMGQSVARTTMSVLVGVSAGVPRVAADLGSIAAALGHGTLVAAGGLGRGLAAVAVGVPRGFGRALSSIPGGLAGLFEGVGRRERSSLGTAADGERRGGPVESPDAAESEAAVATLVDAWERFVAALPVRRPETKTPTELARVAVDSGAPADAVDDLTDAVRRVAYGGADPGEEQSTALRAFERMRQFVEDRR